jgi:Superfamily II DNA/RNA helicase required for DNA uptake (late competence protein)
MDIETLLDRILSNPTWMSRELARHMDSNGEFHYPEELSYDNGTWTDINNNPVVISVQAGIFLERLGELMFLLDLQKRFTIYRGEFGLRKKLDVDANFFSSDINLGSSGGVIDIIIERNKQQQTGEKQWLVLSSKCFLDEKAMNKYDIGDIYAYLREEVYDSTPKDVDIGVLVKNKQKWIKKFEASRSKKYIGKLVLSNVYGFEEIDEWLKEFRYHFKTIDEVKQFCFQIRPKMQLRIHQKVIADNVVYNIKENNQKQHLIPAVCRSGKSFMIAEIIRQLIPTKRRFLYTTNRPGETFLQTRDDIFRKYADFSSLKCKVNKQVLGPDEAGPYLHFISKQYFGRHLDDLKEQYDVIFFDEAHEASSTEQTEKILKQVSDDDTIIVYVTATPRKVKFYKQISDSNTYPWTLIDIENIKHKEFEPVYKKYPRFKEVMKEMSKTEPDVYEMYKIFPKLFWYDLSFTDKMKKVIDKKAYTEEGFSMKSLFHIKDKKLVNKLDIDVMMEQVMTGVKYQIKNLPDNNRTFQDFTGILMFLPFGMAQKIEETGLVLKKYLEQNDLFHNKYDIVFINDDVKSKDPKRDIERLIDMAKKNGKRGIVLLSGNRLSVGISLRDIDVVCLFTHFNNSDNIFQMMMRSMTEDSGKKYGFVVDCNPKRVLTSMLDLHHDKSKSVEENITTILSYLIEIDKSFFSNKSIKQIVQRFMALWKSSKLDMTLVHLFQEEDIQLDIPDDLDFDISHINANMSEEQKHNVPDGIKYKKERKEKAEVDEGKEVKEEKTEEEKEEDRKEKWRDLLIYILPYISFISDRTTTDIEQLFASLSPFEQEIVMGKLNSLSNTTEKNNFITLSSFKRILNKNKTHLFNFMDVINTKVEQNFTLDNKNDLLTFLMKFLKPKEAEKKKNGEVFTPPKLIDEMLDKLKENVSTVYSHPEYKWLDPANGIGNFPICLFYRLMDGLKDKITDKEQRKKHILEKMIYVCELNPANNLVYRKIMEGDKYRLNVFEGDFLTLKDEKPEWKDFDMVMGNPPYNDASGNKGKGHHPWIPFVKQTLSSILKPEGYLLFIHPPLWRNFGSELWDIMASKQFLYLEIHNVKQGSKTFNGCKTRYDWYVLQNIQPTQKTIIRDENGVENHIDIREWKFLPNFMFDTISSLLSHSSEPKAVIISDRSNYGADKPHIQGQDQTHIYPCIYTIGTKKQKEKKKEKQPVKKRMEDGTIVSLLYSNTNKNGHFGISKFIFSNGGGFLCDEKGEFGLTQWAYGIVDEKKNLIHIKQCFLSDEFTAIRQAIQIDKSKYNIKVMRQFRKDFYRQFIDIEPEEEQKEEPEEEQKEEPEEEQKEEPEEEQKEEPEEEQKEEPEEEQKEEPEEEQKEEPEEEFILSKCMKYTKEKLKEFCGKYKLKITGNKTVLCERLTEHFEGKSEQKEEEEFILSKCMKYTKEKLKEFCGKYKLKITGNKTVLCERLTEHFKGK